MNEVLVVGGGMAALELVLALRDLAGERVRITVVAPEARFVARPLLLLGGAHQRPLSEIADELGFTFVRGAVEAIDAEHRRAILHSGATLGYDTLVLAPGAERLPAFEGALHIGEDSLEGLSGHVAFVAPTSTGWLLPLYEAAMIAARQGVRATLVTPEEEPLAMFGEQASAAVRRALEDAGVEFLGGHRGEAITADRVVSLPLIRGPRIRGVPATGLYGLIPVDGYGRVIGLARAYALGDATDFPVKQGAIACQQADIAAEHIVGNSPAPLTPAIGATLVTGAGELALGAAPSGKLPGRYLAAYLEASGRGSGIPA